MAAPRTLLPYQARWVQDAAGVKVIEKSRRVGLSWAEAYDAVMHTGADRGNVYYQSYNKDMTRGFIDDCAEWARALNKGAEAVGEALIRDGGRDVQAFRLELASGREVLAMTSAPRAFRSKGRPGDVAVIDEAAFVDDLDEALKAALAFRQWGGRVRIISTHNGAASPFAALVRDLRDLWVAAMVERVGDVLWTREMVARQDISFSEQRRIVRDLAARYRPTRIAVDQTGMGEAVVEQLQDDHGRIRVEGVLMTGPRRLDVATSLREAMEGRRLRIPPDDALRRDLYSVRAEAGPTGAPRLIAERAGADGHADRFWALALACASAATGTVDYAYRPADPRGRPGSGDGWTHPPRDDEPQATGDRHALLGAARFGRGAW